MSLSTSKVAIVLAFILSACSSTPEFTRDFAENRIVESMSVEEVTQLIGPPDEIEKLKASDSTTQTSYRYLARIDHGKGNVLSKDMTLIFSNNRIIKKSYSERVILKTEKDSRPSNNIFQIK